MSVRVIKLPTGEWEYDDTKRLGPSGGFGDVFLGRSKNENEYGAVAVKRLKLSAEEAAHRELRIGARLMEEQFDHVVPILDAGQDPQSDRYFLVMPVCDHSLQDEINRCSLGIDATKTCEIIRSIIAGLIEVGDITHRDLKPANILFHEGKWKIADFGIAKFVADSTSVETLRESLTPAFAAPEQWNGERPTAAADIYALGIIAYALIDGTPPFVGSVEDLREAHISQIPYPLTKLGPRLSAFVLHMVRKVPESRPTLARCAEVFASGPATNHSAVAQRLLNEAAAQIASKEALEEAELRAAGVLLRKRKQIYEDAKRDLIGIRDHLFSEIRAASESVAVDQSGSLRFGHSILQIEGNPLAIPDLFKLHSAYKASGWDALGASSISLRMEGRGITSYKWSASLIFADRGDGGGFRWYEIAFFGGGYDHRGEPFGLNGESAPLFWALSGARTVVDVAYGPVTIDGEHEQFFVDRWSELVAMAAVGKLSRSSGMALEVVKKVSF